MPNHVINILSFEGDKTKIRQMLEDIKDDEYGLHSVDFNKIIPMPPSLDLEASSRTQAGLAAYKDFIDVYKQTFRLRIVVALKYKANICI